MQLPLRIELRRSRQLSLVLLGLHLLALLCIFLLPWTWPARATLLLFLLLPVVFLRSRTVPVEILRLGAQGELHCLLAGGEFVPAVLAADSAVFEHLVVLRFRLGASRRNRSLTLCSDSMPAGQFRRLRVWLRWRASLRDDALGRV